jgi:hypothetical protein
VVDIILISTQHIALKCLLSLRVCTVSQELISIFATEGDKWYSLPLTETVVKFSYTIMRYLHEVNKNERIMGMAYLSIAMFYFRN